MSHQEKLAALKELAEKSAELYREVSRLRRDLVGLGLDKVGTVGRSADEASLWMATLDDDLHFALDEASRDPVYFDKLKAN